MLKMKLQRVGRRNAPMFRVVLMESRNAASGGKHLEVLGSYNPHMNSNQLDTERVKYWLSQGVQPSDTVHNLLVNASIIEGKKKNVLPKKRPIVKEADEQETEEKQEAKETENSQTEESTTEDPSTEADTEPASESEEPKEEETPQADATEAKEENPAESDKDNEASEGGEEEEKKEQ